MGAPIGEGDQEGYKGYSVVSLPHEQAPLAKVKGQRSNSTKGLFEDAALCFITVSHMCLGKLTSLPFPLGDIVEVLEELVVPIADSIEGFTLRILSAIDDQIYTVGMNIKGSMRSTSEQVNWVLTDIRKQGLLGMSADVWVRHESSIRESVRRIICLLDKIPLVGVATPFVCEMSASLMNALSDWLVEHSQSQDKVIQFKEGERNGRIEKLDQENHEGLKETMKMDVKADEAIKGKGTNTKPDVDQGPTMVGSEGKGVQEDKPRDKKDQVNTERETREVNVGKKTEDENVGKKTQDAGDLSAVLELIDSGWLLGTGGAVSPRMQTAAGSPMPPSSPNPKKSASSRSRKGVLRHGLGK